MKKLIMILTVVGLFGCNGSGGGSPASPSEPANIAGSYSGHYQSTNLTQTGDISMSITQDGSSFSGTYSISNSFCVMSGNMSGTISANSIKWSSSDTGQFRGTATVNGDTISGNYDKDGTSICYADWGTFSITKN